MMKKLKDLMDSSKKTCNGTSTWVPQNPYGPGAVELIKQYAEKYNVQQQLQQQLANQRTEAQALSAGSASQNLYGPVVTTNGNPNNWLQYDPNSVAVATSWTTEANSVSVTDINAMKLGVINLVLNVGVETAIRLVKKCKLEITETFIREIDNIINGNKDEDLANVINEVAKEVQL